MNYLIIGAGGTGGSIGGFLAAAKKDVTLIARGKHLEAIRTSGLALHSDLKGECVINNAQAMTMEEYTGKADVIFISVKDYSLEETLPLLKKAAHENTIIIPILNIFGTGKKLAEKLPDLTIIEGCIYIVAHISGYGEITQRGNIFRVVFGTRGKSSLEPKLAQIAADLKHSAISAVVSEDIACDTFRKFSFVSPMAAAGAYYDIPAGVMQTAGPERNAFIALVEETIAVAKTIGIVLPEDTRTKNLAILDAVTPDTTASLQKDLKKGGQSEIDGFIFEVVRLAKKAGITVPQYEKIARHFGFVPA